MFTTDTEQIEYDDYEGETKKSKDDTQAVVALYIVMPLFIFCYGGSCFLYCVHKIYRNCKRRRKEKMLLEHQEDFTEFEPDTKPNKEAPESESRPEPIVKKLSSSFLFGSRPTTSEGVRIDMASPPGSANTDGLPGYYERTTLKEKVNIQCLDSRAV